VILVCFVPNGYINILWRDSVFRNGLLRCTQPRFAFSKCLGHMYHDGAGIGAAILNDLDS